MSQIVRFSISTIRDEVRCRLESGMLHRRQPVRVLCEFYTKREWQAIAEELQLADIQLSDSLVDLVGREEWSND